MTAEIATAVAPMPGVVITPEQRALILRTIAPDASDDELALFLYDCRRIGVHPLDKLLHFTKRKGRYVPIASIDLLRMRASDTGECLGISDARFTGDEHERSFAATVTVKRIVGSQVAEFTATARWREYYPGDGDPGFMWRKMPHVMLGKCFSADTEVLTDYGFEPFSAVTGRVLHVTASGLEATDARPFQQSYDGPMVTLDRDMLNFCVTPNHDMVTTVGKVEAGAMFETTRVRPTWFVPMALEEHQGGATLMSDEMLRLAGAIAADGSYNGHQRFRVAVSRPYKRELLDTLRPESTAVQHSSGSVAVASSGREITTNFDKAVYTFDVQRVAPLLDTDRAFVRSVILGLSQRQARLVLDTWQRCDGHTNRKTGVRRLYTSRLDHVAAIELLAVVAGYSISTPAPRRSDIGDENYALTIAQPRPQPVSKPVGDQIGLTLQANASGEVWCVTVPSGIIVVRRHGFSMLCGNCAEALALRKGFPKQLSGVYAREELEQADQPETPTEPAAPVNPKNRPDQQPITDAQRKKLWATARGLGWEQDALRAFLFAAFNISSTKELRSGDVDQALELIRRKAPARTKTDEGE